MINLMSGNLTNILSIISLIVCSNNIFTLSNNSLAIGTKFYNNGFNSF